MDLDFTIKLNNNNNKTICNNEAYFIQMWNKRVSNTHSLALSSGRSRYQCSSLIILFSSSSSCFLVSASRPLCMNWAAEQRAIKNSCNQKQHRIEYFLSSSSINTETVMHPSRNDCWDQQHQHSLDTGQDLVPQHIKMNLHYFWLIMHLWVSNTDDEVNIRIKPVILMSQRKPVTSLITLNGPGDPKSAIFPTMLRSWRSSQFSLS